MALLNFVIAYSAKWQGWAAVNWGYPKTLLVDAGLGLVGLLLLPFLVPLRKGEDQTPGAAVPDGVQP